VTQEPFKTPYYVALLLQLSIKPDSQFEVKEEEDAQTGEKRKAEDDGELDCGRDVLENLSIAYRTWVEGREWLNVRQCVCPHLSPVTILIRTASLLLSPTSSGCDQRYLLVRIVQIASVSSDRAWRRWRPCGKSHSSCWRGSAEGKSISTRSTYNTDIGRVDKTCRLNSQKRSKASSAVSKPLS